jgi:hypothetical protein
LIARDKRGVGAAIIGPRRRRHLTDAERTCLAAHTLFA